jgi:hypothetical protein
MDNTNLEKVKVSISNLKEKKCKLYFLVQDTKGYAKASVRYIYEMAYALKQAGFSPVILHEKPDYTSVGKWLDEKYVNELPHQPIEGQNLQVAPEDFLILPEIFGFAMEQLKNLPCGKIVIAQSYRYIVDTLQPGQNWASLGFLKCITTNQKQKEYIEKVMSQTTFDIVEPTIDEIFEPRKLPPMPIVAIHTRDQNDTINIIKTFYLRFPQYRWFTFKDLRGLSEKEFAQSLKECFLSVWIDEDSGHGTFPLESMATGVPVLAKVPYLQPEWMNENNGVWVQDKTLMPDYIADFIQNWLEDNIKPEIIEKGKETSSKYQDKKSFENKVVKLFSSYLETRALSFETQINNLKPTN